MAKKLHLYYQNRAKEYDLVYDKPERQNDLKKLHAYLKKAFEHKTVLEIACGTGYWTQTIAETCQMIHATDINSAVLEIAQSRNYNTPHVLFEQKDLWSFERVAEHMDGLFGGFIWSHLLKKDLPRFLNMVKNLVAQNGVLVFIDNKYVEGSNTPIARIDDYSNTYQIRKLQNGAEYEVLKNFPTKTEMAILIAPFGLEMEWMELDYYWVLKLNKQSH